MRKRLTYANVTATLALVFAMSGGALAANHYLINSTKQINPKVLKKLRGNQGKPGHAGATGGTGATGATGATGSRGLVGPATAGFVSSETVSPTLTGSTTSVIKLSEGSGAIVAPANGHLIVTAHGSFSKNDGTATLADAFCTLEMSTNGGAFAAISKSAGLDLHNAFEIQNIGTTGGAAVTAGASYDVRLGCISFNVPVTFVRGDMTAIATG
jgi:hypothetical protein